MINFFYFILLHIYVSIMNLSLFVFSYHSHNALTYNTTSKREIFFFFWEC